LSARRARAGALLLLALAGLLGGCGGDGGPGPEGGDGALPGVAAPAFAIPVPEPLARGGTATWAPVRRPALARTAPSAGAAAVAGVPELTPEGTRNLVVVRRRARAPDGGLWVEVELPSTGPPVVGWMRRADLGGYATATLTLRVELGALRATLLRGDELLFSAPVGVGTHRHPTPRGRFYVRNRLTRYASRFYGPVAFGTSARSAVLTDWPAGAHVGIHGTDRPDLVPGRVSHGCIRLRNRDVLRLAELMPVGTPVEVV
jgi:L,D-transpeptidase catalytic domain